MEPSRDELRSVQGHTAEDLELDRAETVCKFCGVSYLIFSEVKALEKKLKDVTAKYERVQKAVNAEKERSKAAVTKVQVDALEQKQKYEATINTLKQEISDLNNKLGDSASAVQAAVEAVEKREAAKRDAAIEEATKRSQRQLLVEMNHKADLRSYLKQLPHYLSSVRRLQHERDHLKSLVSDLQHSVKEQLEQVSEGAQRMSAAMRDAQDGVESTRRELNAQLAVEVEKLNARTKDHGNVVADLENQIQMLQKSLTESRKALDDRVLEVSTAKDAEWSSKFEEMKRKHDELEGVANQNEAERAKAIAQLQSELQDARALITQQASAAQHEKDTSSRRLKQAAAAEEYAARVSIELNELKRGHAKLREIHEKNLAAIERSAASEQQLKDSLAQVSGREQQLRDALNQAKSQAEQAAARAASWQGSASDAARVHAAELASAKEKFDERCRSEVAAAVSAERRQLEIHETESSALIERLRKENEELRTQTTDSLTEVRKQMNAQSLKDIEQATRQLQQEHERAFRESERSHKNDLENLQQKLDAAQTKASQNDDLSRQLQQAQERLEEAKLQISSLQSEIDESKASTIHSGESEAEIQRLTESLNSRNQEIERLEDIVHRECLERTDLLARIRELECG